MNFNYDADMKMVQKKNAASDNSPIAPAAVRRKVVIAAFSFMVIIAAALLPAMPAQCEEPVSAPSSSPGTVNNTASDSTTPSVKKQESIPASQSRTEDNVQVSQPKKQETTPVFILTKAVMCEAIKGFEAADPAVVFSISLGKIFCFTAFQNISQNAFIYHKWFHRDRFVATNRFLVKSPQWSTFSTMQLRMADKGPWRVEITDDKDNLLKTLRFSVSD